MHTISHCLHKNRKPIMILGERCTPTASLTDQVNQIPARHLWSPKSTNPIYWLANLNTAHKSTWRMYIHQWVFGFGVIIYKYAPLQFVTANKISSIYKIPHDSQHIYLLRQYFFCRFRESFFSAIYVWAFLFGEIFTEGCFE